MACEACRQQLAADWASLAGLVADEAPPRYLWAAIEASTGLPPDPVVVPVDFGEARGPVPGRHSRRASRRRLIGLTAAAAALVAAVAAGPELVAAIQDAGGPRTSERRRAHPRRAHVGRRHRGGPGDGARRSDAT